MSIHTFVAPLGCIDIRRALLIFFKKCAKWHFKPKLDSIQYAHFKGEVTLYVWIQNAYWISFVSFNQGLSSITKKGEIESASRP
jgi:hypothetical protein